MTADPLNQQVVLLAMPPQEETVRLAEQCDAAAYVARHARDDADRDLLMDILGLASPARTLLLAAMSTALVLLGRHINRGAHRGH